MRVRASNVKNPESHERSIEKLIIGVFLGVLISMPFYFIGPQKIVNFIRDYLVLTVIVIVIFATLAAITLAFKDRLIRKIFGVASWTLEDVASEVPILLDSISRKDADATKNASQIMVVKIAALISSFRLRAWIATVLIACGGVLAGVVGTALIIQQNDLLRRQNGLIDEQSKVLSDQLSFLESQANSAVDQTRVINQQLSLSLLQPLLQEQNRRLPLFSELTEVLARIRLESSESQSSQVKLSESLENDIVRLSLQFKPYPLIDSDRLSANAISEVLVNPTNISEKLVFLSPERGLLLQALLEWNIQLDQSQLEFADFSYADMRGVRLLRPELRDGVQFLEFMTKGDCSGLDDLGIVHKQINILMTNADFSDSVIEGFEFDPYSLRLDNSRIVFSKMRSLLRFNRAAPLAEKALSFSGASLEHSSVEMTLSEGVVDLTRSSMNCLTEESFRVAARNSDVTVLLDGMQVLNVAYSNGKPVSKAKELIESEVSNGNHTVFLPNEFVSFVDSAGYQATIPDIEISDFISGKERFVYSVRKREVE